MPDSIKQNQNQSCDEKEITDIDSPAGIKYTEIWNK